MKYLLILLIGVLIGQRYTLYKFDHTILETNAIKLTEVSYLRGCLMGIRIHNIPIETDFYICRKLSEENRKDNEDIIRNKLWDK